jgi:hypothetical protein
LVSRSARIRDASLLLMMSVAQVGVGVAAFVQAGADRLGELGFDRGLVDRFGGLVDAVAGHRRP